MRLLTLLTILLTQIACNGKDGGNKSLVKDTENSPSGSYLGECINFSSTSEKEVMSFSDSSVEVTTTTYIGFDCVQGSEYQESKFVYLQEYDGDQLHLTNQNKYYMFFSTSDAQNGNDVHWCEINDWTAQIFRAVTNKNCGGDTFWSGDVSTTPLEIISNSKIDIDGAVYSKN